MFWHDIMFNFKITISTMSLFPNAAAKCKGVSSPIFVVWTRAPRLISISTIFVWPPLAAQCNGENWWSSLKYWKYCIDIIIRNLDTEYNRVSHRIMRLTYPWFISCSVSSSHMRTFIASPFLIQWKMSSMMSDGLFIETGFQLVK